MDRQQISANSGQKHFSEIDSANMKNDHPVLNKVFLGDARKMPEIDDSFVDLIITSPPYFSIKDYSKDGYQNVAHSKKILGQLGDISHFDEFISQLTEVWRECERVLKPNGKLIINTPLIPMLKKDMSTHENRHIFDLNSAIQQSILSSLGSIYLVDTYIWNRTNSSKKLMFGSYPYPSNFYAQNTVEFVTVYVKAGKSRKVSESVKSKSRLTQTEWVEFTKQIWDIPIPNRSDKAFGKHTALMPEEIVRRCVRLYSFFGDVVLDPFAGSGTTLKVAKELGRNFIGYELVESYSEIINEKLEANICFKSRRTKAVPIKSSVVPSRFINKIQKCDAFEFLNAQSSNSVPLACVDPPYNLGKGSWDLWSSDAAYMSFTKKWLDEVFRILAPGGGLFVFNTPRNSARILAHAEARGMNYENWITWDKRDGFAATKRKFVPVQETILYLSKPGSQKYFDPDAIRVPYQSTDRIAAAEKKGILKNGKRWFPNKNGKLCTDVWHITSERHKTKVNGRIIPTEHPTQKPIELIERIIKSASRPGDIVLDCFMGTGTTAVAALRHGRRFIGCEFDAKYYENAISRIEREKKLK